MIRRTKYLFLIIFVLFFKINIVSADTCAQIDEKIILYNNYTQALSELNCEDNTDSENVATCNSYNIKRNLMITDLMKENEKGNICANQKNEVDKIIKENKNRCGKIFDDNFSDFVDGVMAIFYILGPIFLIFFGSLDYSKAVVSSEADSLKKANKNFAKRVAATILLFLSPLIVNIIISMNVSSKYLSGNAYSCDFNYLVFQKQYIIKYVPKVNKGNSSAAGRREGNYILYNQCDSAWGSDKLINSNSGNTVCKAGCAITSISMQIANSGVASTSSFSPKEFNISLREHQNPNNGANVEWGQVGHLTNNKFALERTEYISGNINDKAVAFSNYLSQGYYPVVQVKYGTNSSTHYVAIFEVIGSRIIAGDPSGGNLITLNDTSYPIATQNISTFVVLYKVVN